MAHKEHKSKADFTIPGDLHLTKANPIIDTSDTLPKDLLLKCGANKTVKLESAVWED